MMDLRERLSVRDHDVATLDDPFAEVKNRIHLALIQDLGRQLFAADIAAPALRQRVNAEVRNRLDQEPGLARSDRERLVEELTDDILGHGPVERLLADESITEVMINGPHDVWIERAGVLHKTTVRFEDESHLRRIINKIVAQVGRRIDEASPMVDARLPDGSRVNAIIPPLSLSGPIVTIREFGRDRLDLQGMVKIGTL